MPRTAGAGVHVSIAPAAGWNKSGSSHSGLQTVRGVARGESTCFPCTMARGESFDVDLERRTGEAASRFQSVVTPTGIEPVFQP